MMRHTLPARTELNYLVAYLALVIINLVFAIAGGYWYSWLAAGFCLGLAFVGFTTWRRAKYDDRWARLYREYIDAALEMRDWDPGLYRSHIQANYLLGDLPDITVDTEGGEAANS